MATKGMYSVCKTQNEPCERNEKLPQIHQVISNSSRQKRTTCVRRGAVRMSKDSSSKAKTLAGRDDYDDDGDMT